MTDALSKASQGTRSRAVLVVLAVALTAGGYLLGSLHQASKSSILASRLAALETNQKTLEAGYLNAIPRSELAGALGYRAKTHQAPDLSGELNRMQPTPEQASRAQQQRLQAMEQAFMAEPVDPVWAGPTLHAVEDSIVTSATEIGIDPKAITADCRSSSCMITMSLGANGDVDHMLESLTTEISGELPTTTTVQTLGPDGRITIHMLGNRE